MRAIKDATDYEEVFVDPPYVFGIADHGTCAIRHWLPESLDAADVGVGTHLTLRPVPPNAPSLAGDTDPDR